MMPDLAESDLYYFDADAADRPVRFAAKYLRHYEGRWAGQPFAFLPWQAAVVRALFGWKRKADGLRRFWELYLLTAKGSGKALALDTEVPTPDGYKTMGSLQPGDCVFDEKGKPTEVTGVSDVMYGHPCYELTFFGGQKIVADAEHLWETLSTQNRWRPATTTTADIARSVTYGGRPNYRSHKVRLGGPLELPDADLPIDPYVLGAWLGDGESGSPRMAVGFAEREMISHVEAAGYPCVVSRQRTALRVTICDEGTSTVEGGRTRRRPSFRFKLRDLGLLGNKHIPVRYLRGSAAQRTALLQGLMDTDGCIGEESGICEFTSMSARLADDVYELVCSLGFRGSRCAGIASVGGVECGTKHRITFVPYRDRPVFRLSRKLARQKDRPRYSISERRAINSCEPVPSVPVRCLKVANPSGLFLATRSCVITHNTPMLAAIGMYMLLADGEAGAHVMSCATDFQQAYLTMDAGKKYVAADRTLGKLCDPKQFEIRGPQNGKWTVLSGTAEGRHGFRPSCLLMDEAHEWPSGKLYENLTANTTKRQQPLTLVATNAGGSNACFARTLHDRAVAAMEGRGTAGDTLLPVIFEADEQLDWAGEAAARQANPSLGSVITFEQLGTEVARARESPEAEGRYRRLFLSQWQGTGAGRWIDMPEWDACVAATAALAAPPAKAPLYVGMDLAQSDDLCAVVLVWPTPERLHVDAHFWLPRGTARRYEARDGIPYAAWAAAGHITLVEEPTISSAVRRTIADHVLRLRFLYKLEALAYDVYRADETVATLEAAGLKCVPITQGYRTSPGCFELERRVKERSVVITPNAVLRWCAENAEVERNSYGEIRVTKPDARGRRARKVDGITALVTALVEARRHSFPKQGSKAQAWIV